MNEIYLRFDKMIVGLAGYDYGKTVYEEQVSNKIDFSKKIIIVFPDQIQRIASSFIQGFFDEIVKRIGIAGIEKQIEIKEIDIAKEFIETMLHNAKVNADVIATQEDNLIKINIKGKEATCLIGRRGETLDAVQFLTGLALNKINKDSHCRVLVDIENYREKREQSLIRYANKVAREVAKTKKTKKLDYMNPYERRIVHSALQNDKYVITYSEGTDPYRRLVIEYKR